MWRGDIRKIRGRLIDRHRSDKLRLNFRLMLAKAAGTVSPERTTDFVDTMAITEAIARGRPEEI
jgi:hypothetical protein